MPDDTMLISHGWTWRCLQCGAMDGAYITEGYALAAAEKHQEEEGCGKP